MPASGFCRFVFEERELYQTIGESTKMRGRRWRSRQDLTWDVGLSREAPVARAQAGVAIPFFFLQKPIVRPLACSCCSSRFSITSSLSQAAGASHVHSFLARSSSESSFPSLLHPVWVTFDHPPARLDTSPSIALLHSLSKLKPSISSPLARDTGLRAKLSLRFRLNCFNQSCKPKLFDHGTRRQAIDDSSLRRCKPA